MDYVVICFFCGISAGVIGRWKGSSFLLWFVIGAVLPLLGTIAALFWRFEDNEPHRACEECGNVVPLYQQVDLYGVNKRVSWKARRVRYEQTEDEPIWMSCAWGKQSLPTLLPTLTPQRFPDFLAPRPGRTTGHRRRQPGTPKLSCFAQVGNAQ